MGRADASGCRVGVGRQPSEYVGPFMTQSGNNLTTRRATSTNLAEQSQTLPGGLGQAAYYPTPERQDDAADKFMAALSRQRWVIAGVAALVAAAGIGLTLREAPKYSATALLMLDPTPDQIVPDRQAVSGRADAGIVDSEIEAIKSPVLVTRLASELELDRDPEWAPTPDESQPKRELAASAPRRNVGFERRSTGVVEAVPARYAPQAGTAVAANSPTPVARSIPDEVTDAVASALDVKRRGLSYVVEVSAISESPARAAEMANGLSSIYLSSLTEAREESSQEANGWLDERLEELRREVHEKTAAAQRYRAQRNLLTAQGSSLAEQQMVEIQSSLMATRAEYAQHRAQYELVSSLAKSGGSLNSLDIPDDTMRDLRSKEATLSQRIADLQTRYGKAHPTLLQAYEEKQALDERIATEMQRLASSAKLRADSVGARLNTQQSQLNSLHGKLVSDDFDEVQLDALETDAQAARVVYESFLQRSHEIASQGAPAAVAARLLAPARPPTSPSSPHLLLNSALSIAAGILLGLLAGIIAERSRKSIDNAEEAEEKLGVRALVTVPDLNKRDLQHIPERNRSPTGYMLAKRLSQFTESFRVLQTAVMLASAPHKNVVAVTSAMPGDGKTTLSLGLARVAGMGGLRAIIVDCDVRMRTINRLLDIEPEVGLQQVLSGEKDWREVVGTDAETGTHVLPASGLTTKDIFSTGAMERLVAELSQNYEMVVLDCAPIFAVADTRVVAALADNVVVAVRSGKTPARAVRAAIAQLNLAGANVLGVVINRADIRKGRKRSFYDGLYYSKAFSGYYTREA
jgi:succinoglycan biosynthesis transport protein ExoP